MKTTLPVKLWNKDPFTAVFGENPFAYLRRLAPNVDRLFDEFPWRHPAATLRPFEAETWMPRLDVFERDGTFVLRADLPGMTKENVKVEVKEDMVTIEGERKNDFEEEKDGIYRVERAYGSFYRAVPLPEGIKAETVKATFKDGVLEVTAALPPATIAKKGRTVEIEELKAKEAKPAA